MVMQCIVCSCFLKVLLCFQIWWLVVQMVLVQQLWLRLWIMVEIVCCSVNVGKVGIFGGRQLFDVFLSWIVVIGSIRLFSWFLCLRLLYLFRNSIVLGIIVDSRFMMMVVLGLFMLKLIMVMLLMVVLVIGWLRLMMGVLVSLEKVCRQLLKLVSRMCWLNWFSGMLVQCGSQLLMIFCLFFMGGLVWCGGCYCRCVQVDLYLVQ